jgi:hypothetical protein
LRSAGGVTSLDEAPVCSRALKYKSGDRESDVIIRVWRPVCESEHLEEPFWCRFEVVGLPEPLKGRAAGIDGMQALICALQAIRVKLKPFNDGLSFLGGPYEEFAEILVGAVDPGRRCRILDILDEEQYAAERLLEQRREARPDSDP